MAKIKRAFINRRTAKAGALMKIEGKSANEIAAMIRPTKDTFLQSTAWKEMRKKVIEKYGAKCLCCGFIPKIPEKINIDHIKPRRYFPELSLDMENLQPLCHRCNKDKGNKHQTDYRRRQPLL